jgi:NAD(P)-dependent dehydrogenase (short-subunit alcohol dehydrogenase family)
MSSASTTQNFHSLAGKIVLITGGTQGLGEAIARLFAKHDAAGIIITGRQQEKGEKLANELSATGTPTHFVQADLADSKAPDYICAAADQKFGRIDVLVNAAGDTDRGTILDATLDLYDRIMAVNVRAPFFLIQQTAKIMIREKIQGSIINIQSMSAHGGQPFLAPYSISKGALATLTKNTAYGLMPWRIRVNGLNIGWMNTPGEDMINKKRHGAKDGWLDNAVKGLPYGRLVEPSEVARACLYLASDASGLMSGANIDFDQSVNGAYDNAARPISVL